MPEKDRFSEFLSFLSDTPLKSGTGEIDITGGENVQPDLELENAEMGRENRRWYENVGRENPDAWRNAHEVREKSGETRRNARIHGIGSFCGVKLEFLNFWSMQQIAACCRICPHFYGGTDVRLDSFMVGKARGADRCGQVDAGRSLQLRSGLSQRVLAKKDPQIVLVCCLIRDPWPHGLWSACLQGVFGIHTTGNMTRCWKCQRKTQTSTA